MARPMGYQEAEVLAANLVALGYSARAYPHKPTGHRVVVGGQRGGQPFRYQITNPETPLETILGHLRSGMVGEDKNMTEGIL